MSLLAVDIGSSTCKAVVFACSGQVLAQHSANYVAELPCAPFAEMHPDTFWHAVCSCCRKGCESLTDPVQALCLSSQGETFVPVDSHGAPLMNAILNQDGRAIRESDWCAEIAGHVITIYFQRLTHRPRLNWGIAEVS
jgi:xylulokinase